MAKNFKCPKVVLDPKYGIPSEPEFMSAPIDYDIPKYEDQGQTRGRKPFKESKKGSGKGRAKQAKSQKVKKAMKVKGKGKAKKVNKIRKTKVARVRRALEQASASSGPVIKTRKARKVTKAKAAAPTAPKAAAPTAPEAAAPTAPEASHEASEDTFEIPKDAIAAPEHVSYNQVYSTAYRRAKGVDAKLKGQHASWLLRVHGKISPSLSGNPRAPKAKPN